MCHSSRNEWLFRRSSLIFIGEITLMFGSHAPSHANRLSLE
ncbi:hypothetical protein CAter282_1745 [Collimonas arenae]|uniref:Uncharacterized protein n=1 Tax=Collimonas arenae TaxID=279058 RepID=A0A127QI86_9BURK|nr:hypothetical protein CAter10_1879 [Collimonas arenae]AMP09525.1 hypothetical protein CAter282_1745 [Collimonas arenae]